MKKFILIFCALPAVAFTQVKKPVKPAIKVSTPVRLNGVDSFSYAIGVGEAFYYKAQGATKVNPDMVRKAFEDVYGNKTLLLSPEQCDMTIQNKLAAYMSNKSSSAKEEGKKFLANNKKRAGVVELPNGLQYEIIRQGTGEKPKATDTIMANYSGTLINGEEFDNSYKRGQPLVIPLNRVIQGWTQGIQLMPVGSKWRLYIPSDLGYGDRGAGNAIPGGATLIFEIELLEIVNKK